MTELPRGLRNNNPGNIKESPNDKTHWIGERATNDDPVFEEFDTPWAGIRALYIILRGYQRARGLKTTRQIIDRWAPPIENDTGAYVNSVAGAVGYSPDQPIDLIHNKKVAVKFIAAVIKHENGQQPFSDEEILSAIEMA